MSYGPFNKYPDEIKKLPYVEWEKVLGTATLVTSDWSSNSDDLVIDTSSIAGTKTQSTISGGVAGTSYVIENQVTLSDGQIRIIQIDIDVLTDDVP